MNFTQLTSSVFLVLHSLFCGLSHAADSRKPNIVVIMADDLGWMDLHCYGNKKLDTPSLDRLATQGMRFTNAYAASPVCTPTRAAMMTGQSPARLQITNHAPGNPDGFALKDSPWQEASSQRHLPLAAVTIAERLSASGYATAHIGKWHLSFKAKGEQGVTEKDLRPEKQGFDLNIGGNSLGGPPSYFSPYRNPTLVDGKEGEYLPERLADEAIAFVRQPRDKPFFLNWWPFSVHYPMQAREEVIAKYRQRGDIEDPIYAAMIEDMDTAIGRFLKALDEAGLSENTLVLFNSDNGGYNGDNRPLRGLKGMLYEGGIRVPWIVRWPGKVQPGVTNDTPVISTDCYPTLLEAADITPTPNHPLDGKSILPLLTQSSGIERNTLYFHYPNYAFHKQNRLGSAIREDDFKLIKNYDDDSLELYNLRSDIGEKNNLVTSSPELAKRLASKLEGWLQERNAQYPVRKSQE
jgi:arylsulfatase A